MKGLLIILFAISFFPALAQETNNSEEQTDGLISEIIVASIGAAITGIILLLIHHSKVKQELELHRKKEIFERKQDAYRKILNQVFKLRDYSFILGPDVDWRETRYLYNEIVLIGSNEVINTVNDFMKNQYTGSREQVIEMVKKIWSAIRKDLYEEDITFEQIVFVSPRKSSVYGLDLYAKYLNKLKPVGLVDLDSLKNMDVNDIHSKTAISKEELSKIKKMAEWELKSIEYFEKFFGNK